MTNECNYEIKSGISKDEILLLNQYLSYIEENRIFSRKLSEIIDENPSILYEPEIVEMKGDFDFKDLAFIYIDSKIVGHYCHQFIRKETQLGNHTTIKLEEQNVPSDFSDDFRRDYIMKRINGNLKVKGTIHEKSHQK